jgi:hypothetical protein
MRMESAKPFPAALRDLLEERELSQRGLSKLIEDKARNKREYLSLYSVNYLIQGRLAPTMRSTEAIARALSIDPNYFAEYRLEVARRALDPDVVGLRTALRNLER